MWVLSATPRPPPIPIVQEAGRASEPVWSQRLEENPFASARDWTPSAQSVVRHYTDWATPASVHLFMIYVISSDYIVSSDSVISKQRREMM
jgi:hypothetical protein